MFESGGVTVRTVAPFDWLAYLRQWKVELEEVREPRGSYYRIKSEAFARVGVHLGVYLPDDRTIVYEKEEVIKDLIAREVPTAPGYLRGAEWEGIRRDLVAFAMDTSNDGMAKRMNLGRPQDAPIPAFFKGVDRLVLGLANSAALTPHGEVTARDPQAAEGVARTIKRLADLGRATINPKPDQRDEFVSLARLARGFLSKLQVEQQGRAVTAKADGFGTFADFGPFLKWYVETAEMEMKAQQAKADPKSEKR
jgi:hypothetical protein